MLLKRKRRIGRQARRLHGRAYHQTPTMRPITLEPLLAESFAPFGTVIANPVIHAPAARDAPVVPQPANQGTAQKYSPIAPLVDAYRQSTSARGSEPRVSIFVCSPRPIDLHGQISQAVLERHPFTTQAFIPMGLSTEDAERRAFIVIVAPHIEASNSKAAGAAEVVRPDLGRARAFLARGDQGITYGVGTWHAPMIVVGDGSVEFVVVQFMNGIERDDCVEWWMEKHGEMGIKVDASSWYKGKRRKVKL
jgi:ureidoglycolate lyase